MFRGYTQDELDALYDTRRRVPDWEAFTDRFEARSARLRERMPDALDLPYGRHPRERLDLFLPVRVELPPVHMFFHGGYWRSGTKERYSYVAEGFLPVGAAVAVVEYALVPEVSMDELVRQVRASVTWLATNARALGVDGGRITVSGHSAGGHIVGMLMAGGWAGAGIVKGGLGLSGLYDLEPIRRTYLNQTLALDRMTAERNSPALLNAATAAPLALAVGGDEGDEFLRQQQSMQRAWEAQAVPVSPIVIPSGNHYTVVEDLGDPAGRLAPAVHRQMGLASPAP
ncbi:MAG TPA: alpha/beta hydrolase [Gaiellales bacterium]|nr:alpha/beta hydrolase [Gaiellales bacterium]